MRNCPQCGAECQPTHKFCPACGFPIGALRTAAGDPLIGRTLGGAYVVLEHVGSGGMGRVYRAEQASLGKTLAVKVIHPHLISDESATTRFYTEARASSRLNHPNTVSVLDFGRTDDGLLYLVMEFLRGKDLAHVLWEEGPLPAPRAVGILRQTLAALSDAHDLGIIHRDIKPENILIEPLRTGGDFVKVVDFGLAKVRSDVAPSVTMPGIVCGTPDYMAPEQGRGDPLDPRSDLYSCGVVLFQILTGRLPYEADSPTQMVLMHMTEPAPDPRSLMPTIPDAIAECTLKALSKEAKDRYQSAVEFADALAAALRAGEKPPPGASRVARVDGATAESTAQLCTNCGAQLVPGVKFCGECGARVPGAVPMTTSPTPRQSVPIRNRVSMTPGPAITVSEARQLPFVGREAELAFLEQQRDRASRGQLVAVRVQGEQGSGRHRLVTALLDRARARGDATIAVSSDVFWSSVAYAPIRACVQQCLGLGPGDDPLAWLGKVALEHPRAVDRVLRAGFEELFTVEGPAHLDGRARREAVVRALVFAFTQAAAQAASGVLVVAFENLARVDTASMAVLVSLTARPVEAPVLVVGTHPTRHDPRWAHAETVSLGGLRREQAAQALSAVVQNSVPEATAALEAVGEGEVLPLYVDQLARWLLEGGGQAPPRLVDLVSSRFERLPPRARRAVQVLALLGEASPKIMSRALGEDIDSLTTQSLRLHGWAHVERDEKGERYQISHALLREVAEASIPAAAGRELHQRCAEVLEDEPVPLEARAMHAEHGDDPFQALILLERVGDRALARGDDLGAALVLRRGLERARRELVRGEIDEPERAIAIFARKLGDALVRAGEASEAEGVLREALELLSWSHVEWAKLQGALARALYARGRTPEALKAIDEAVKAARRLGARTAAVELTTTRAELELSLGNAAEAVTQLRAADELLRDAMRSAMVGSNRGSNSAANDPLLLRLRADVLLRLAGALRAVGDEQAAGEPLLEAREIAERQGMVPERVRCDAEGAERAERMGDRRAAAMAWRRAAEGARETGDAIAERIYLDREARLSNTTAHSAGA